MRDPIQLVIFRLEEQRYALPLAAVVRIVRAVEITLLPHAPAIVLGIMDLAGQVLPVLNLRRRFGVPEREILPADQFLVAHTGRRTVALVVDEAQEVRAYPESAVIGAGRIVPGLDYIEGVVQLEDGMVLIHALGKFLSLEEERDLTAALQPVVTRGP